MIKELVRNYVKAFEELKEATGVLSNSTLLQCSTEGFLRLLEQYKTKPIVEDRDCDTYPYRVIAVIEGYRFYTILTEKEYETYMKGRVA